MSPQIIHVVFILNNLILKNIESVLVYLFYTQPLRHKLGCCIKNNNKKNNNTLLNCEVLSILIDVNYIHTPPNLVDIMIFLVAWQRM